MIPGIAPNREARKSISLRVDPAVLEWFRQRGRNWQTEMHNVLRLYMQSNIQD